MISAGEFAQPPRDGFVKPPMSLTSAKRTIQWRIRGQPFLFCLILTPEVSRRYIAHVAEPEPRHGAEVDPHFAGRDEHERAVFLAELPDRLDNDTAAELADKGGVQFTDELLAGVTFAHRPMVNFFAARVAIRRTGSARQGDGRHFDLRGQPSPRGSPRRRSRSCWSAAVADFSRRKAERASIKSLVGVRRKRRSSALFDQSAGWIETLTSPGTSATSTPIARSRLIAPALPTRSLRSCRCQSEKRLFDWRGVDPFRQVSGR